MTACDHPAPARLADSFTALLLERLISDFFGCSERGSSPSDYLASMRSYEKLTQTDQDYVLPSLTTVIENWNEYAQDPRPAKKRWSSHHGFYIHGRNGRIKVRPAESRWRVSMMMFGTTEGYMGRESNSIEEGDTIWIIKGSDVPLAVRELPSYAANNAPQYQFLREAYVHGVMHGEALAGREPEWETLCLV